MSQVELLNQQIQALRNQIAALEGALDMSEARDREANAKIADLGRRLNVALAQRVQELNRYRSDFFGGCARSCRTARASASSATASSSSPRCCFRPAPSRSTRPARSRDAPLAEAILELQREIPPEISWVLRVDGHTDNIPCRAPADSATTGNCRPRARPRW
jgi:chemotaxis protein MotB